MLKAQRKNRNPETVKTKGTLFSFLTFRPPEESKIYKNRFFRIKRHAPLGRHDTVCFADLKEGFRSIGPLGFAELPKRLPFGSRPADLRRRLPEGVGQEAMA
jgi:hypothetical protein